MASKAFNSASADSLSPATSCAATCPQFPQLEAQANVSDGRKHHLDWRVVGAPTLQLSFEHFIQHRRQQCVEFTLRLRLELLERDDFGLVGPVLNAERPQWLTVVALALRALDLSQLFFRPLPCLRD